MLFVLSLSQRHMGGGLHKEHLETGDIQQTQDNVTVIHTVRSHLYFNMWQCYDNLLVTVTRTQLCHEITSFKSWEYNSVKRSVTPVSWDHINIMRSHQCHKITLFASIMRSHKCHEVTPVSRDHTGVIRSHQCHEWDHISIMSLHLCHETLVSVKTLNKST